MFKITRKTEEVKPSAEVQKTLLTELDNKIVAEDLGQAKVLAEIYKTVAEADKPAEKRNTSDSVKVAWISAAASVVGILAVIRHEDVNVVASKALGLVIKPKI